MLPLILKNHPLAAAVLGGVFGFALGMLNRVLFQKYRRWLDKKEQLAKEKKIYQRIKTEAKELLEIIKLQMSPVNLNIFKFGFEPAEEACSIHAGKGPKYAILNALGGADIQNQVFLLMDYGYVEKVKFEGFSGYRITHKFTDLLKRYG
ncbi:MAG: hypothetical protein LBR90_02885 [Elusimicrobiota bacterium]|jgi:hypothetical protein|nr:hypothetical protein [Elusimicrobiota bacterium]